MTDHTTPQQADRRSGVGRILIAIYIVLALAATGRSVYQLIDKFEQMKLNNVATEGMSDQDFYEPNLTPFRLPKN